MSPKFKLQISTTWFADLEVEAKDADEAAENFGDFISPSGIEWSDDSGLKIESIEEIE